MLAMRVKLTIVLALILASPFVFNCATIRPPKHAHKTERTMIVTGYCKCAKCCGWRRNWRLRPTYVSGPNKGKRKKVGITASGTKAKVGTIAADTALYPFGTVMYIPGYGYGRVEDRGGDIKGNRLDLYFKSHKDAMKWGKQTKKVKIWRPSK